MSAARWPACRVSTELINWLLYAKMHRILLNFMEFLTCLLCLLRNSAKFCEIPCIFTYGIPMYFMVLPSFPQCTEYHTSMTTLWFYAKLKNNSCLKQLAYKQCCQLAEYWGWINSRGAGQIRSQILADFVQKGPKMGRTSGKLVFFLFFSLIWRQVHQNAIKKGKLQGGWIFSSVAEMAGKVCQK
jgi:hypothetical protein